VEEIAEVYIQAWKLGLKSVAIYRDGCKKSQPMVVKGDKEDGTRSPSNANAAPSPVYSPALVSTAPAPDHPIDERDAEGPPPAHRHRLHLERASLTHKFKIAGHEGYITVGVFPNGMPGEIFITMAKEGSTVGGLMDSFALAISMALQHGVPLKLLCEKFKHTRFEPSGWTGNENIGYATSVMDYLFRWLEQKFVTGQQQLLFPGMKASPHDQPSLPENGVSDGARSPSNASASSSPSTADRRPSTGHPADMLKELVDMGDAPSCSFCGSIMTRNGSCFRCQSCGSTSGCS
jgi:ribonucleoside-diphosphate reductase alpha chain